VTDAAYAAPAAFGMARVRAARHDTSAAVDALDLVPPTSRGYPESRQLRADVLLAGSHVDLAVLDQALTSIESVRMDPAERARYTVRILQRALEVVGRDGAARGGAAGKVGRYPADEASIRDALEESYRTLARDAADLRTRVELVNEANAVRNWTLV
jgi:serine/threonine-protein kinase PknG